MFKDGKLNVGGMIEQGQAMGAKYDTYAKENQGAIQSQAENFAKSMGVEVMMRSQELSSDSCPTILVLQDIYSSLNEQGFVYDAIVTLQPTSPLRTAIHIREACDLFTNDPDADSLVSCIRVPHIFHPESVMVMTSENYLQAY